MTLFDQMRQMFSDNLSPKEFADTLARDMVRQLVKSSRPKEVTALAIELHRQHGEVSEPISNFETMASTQLAGF